MFITYSIFLFTNKKVHRNSKLAITIIQKFLNSNSKSRRMIDI